MANQGEKKSQSHDLPADLKDWTAEQVRHWALQLEGVDDKDSEILFQAKINGPSLLLLDQADILSVGVCLGPAKLIIQARDEVLKQREEQATSSTHKPRRSCRPSPFGRYHSGTRYTEGTILTVNESGALDLIEPCHEFKAFTNTPQEKKMEKFTNEVLRFGSACMNSRTNGTIHFGIADKPQGQVLGVVVEDKESYDNNLRSAIKRHFLPKRVEEALKCIKSPRFVGLLNKNLTSSDKYVIEVDIVPDSEVTKDFYYLINNKSKNGDKQCYVREGASSCNILPKSLAGSATKEKEKFERFKDGTKQLFLSRKDAEQKQLDIIKRSTYGSRLSQMITGGTVSLDKSHFERYVIVANKLPPGLSESVQFLVELNPTAVLDFDPQSLQGGLHHFFSELSPVIVHIPADYKITEGVEDIAERLKITRMTSWVFCNGGVGDEQPSDVDKWSMEKGESVREVCSLLCRREVLRKERFLVIFLVFSTLTEDMDPLVETFFTFCQKFRGDEEQLLCICDSKKTFISWKDQISSRCRMDISSRCVFELSFAEVNATTLSLFSKNRLLDRFLPSTGGTVLLEKKFERSLSALEVLCTNQCEGGHEEKNVMEENFYRGGKVSWWNFSFSEEPGSFPFIKRDKFDIITDLIKHLVQSSGHICAVFDLLHLPGCGGTTLAMHILWVLRKEFRCAVLRDNNAGCAEIATQVVQLLTFKYEEKSSPLPVLMMVDDFDDKEKVLDLKEAIEEECAKTCVRSKSVQVIILNCMTSESRVGAEDRVFIGNVLSDTEKQLFDKKLIEIERTHPNAQETFYGFMFMKKNFSSDYAKGVVSKTLRGFDINQKEAQLLAILALLHKYCRCASLSVSLCEEFLDQKAPPMCETIKIEDGFGNFSTLLTTCQDESKVIFQAVKMIHSSIAHHCLEELANTYKISKAKIAELLLTTDKLYECTQGKVKLIQDISHILVKRYNLQEKVSQFSPLVQDIAKESPGLEETVLENAAKRFPNDPVINQLLARYFYLKKKNFPAAKRFAKKAKELCKDSSFMADTTAQVLKHEIRSIITEQSDHLDPESTRKLLEMSQTAIGACQETQRLARIESLQRLKTKTDNSVLNTSGFLGEIQLLLLVTEVLEKTPVFSPKDCRFMLSQVLSGEPRLADVERFDRCKIANRPYYEILKEFTSLLHNAKRQMKEKIDFLDNFFVNLGSRLGMKDIREQESQKKLSECFSQYVDIFCKVGPAPQSWRPEIQELLRARQYLEKTKGDSYSGILSYLSNFNDPQIMDNIVQNQRFLDRYNLPMMEKINFIYANVVLSCIKPESPIKSGFKDLTEMLFYLLGKQISLDLITPLYFIAVVLLWPDMYTERMNDLSEYISQLRTSYHNQMSDMYNGKSPIVHFFLGRRPGYGKLVHQNHKVIKKYISSEDKWDGGKIWREKEVKDLLLRVQGVINRDSIRVGPHQLEVTPVFKSHLRRYNQGSIVSFFIGFTMKGPVALDITDIH